MSLRSLIMRGRARRGGGEEGRGGGMSLRSLIMRGRARQGGRRGGRGGGHVT